MQEPPTVPTTRRTGSTQRDKRYPYDPSLGPTPRQRRSILSALSRERDLTAHLKLGRLLDDVLVGRAWSLSFPDDRHEEKARSDVTDFYKHHADRYNEKQWSHYPWSSPPTGHEMQDVRDDMGSEAYQELQELINQQSRLERPGFDEGQGTVVGLSPEIMALLNREVANLNDAVSAQNERLSRRQASLDQTQTAISPTTSTSRIPAYPRSTVFDGGDSVFDA